MMKYPLTRHFSSLPSMGVTQRYVNEILLFNEDTIRKMIRILWEKEGQVVEASGAISIAPIVETPNRFTGKRTVAVITGGNMRRRGFPRHSRIRKR